MTDGVFGGLKVEVARVDSGGVHLAGGGADRTWEFPGDPGPGRVKIISGRYRGKEGDLLWTQQASIVGVRITLKKEPVIVTLFSHDVEPVERG